MTVIPLVDQVDEAWPHCVHCGAAVDDNPAHLRPIHYWSEEPECHELPTMAEAAPAEVAALPDAWWQHHREYPG